MKAWPLRWKIALYAATFGMVATIAGAATTWVLMRRFEIADFDRQLASDAKEFLREARQVQPVNKLLPENFAYLRPNTRFIEIRDSAQNVIYSSPNLQGGTLADGIEDFHTRKLGASSVRLATFRDDRTTLTIGADLGEIRQIGRDIVFGMFGAIPTVLVVVAIGGRWVAGRALGPVEELRQAAARISPRHLDERLPMPPAKDEIAGLVSVLNDTFERLQRSFEQSIRFSADASHHLKTPLAVLRAGIEELLNDPDSLPSQQIRANALLEQVRHLTSVSENLLLLARADAGRLDLDVTPFNLREVLDGAVDDIRTLAESPNISVEIEMEDNLTIAADRFAIALIVQNLIDNAIKYNRPGGSVRLGATKRNGKVEITVANTSEPIPSEKAASIFERFYRARADHRIVGQGLGLSIARELALAHDGQLALVRSANGWTEFRLILPMRSEGGEITTSR